MHQLVLLAALPQLVDLLCDLCKSGHSDLVFIFPDLNVSEIEKARDNLYLYDDTSDLQEVFQFKPPNEIQPVNSTMGEVFTPNGEENGTLGSIEDSTNETALGVTLALPENQLEHILSPSQKLNENDESSIQMKQKHTTNATTTKLSCKECPFRSKYKKVFRQHSLNVHKLKQLASSTSAKEKVDPDANESDSESEIKTTNNSETKGDPGADFEIMYEESFLGSIGGSSEAIGNTFEDSGVQSISDVDSLVNSKSLESLSVPGLLFEPVQESKSMRDSGITNMGDFDWSTPEWKKSASPMVYNCQNCNYKSFTRIMLNRHNMENHEGSINKRRLTIANSEDLHTLSCESCSFSTKWKQALELHMISNHKNPERREGSCSQKRKRVFDSPLLRTLSMRPQIKFVKMQSEANFLKTCFSPETSHHPKRKKDDEVYGFAQEFTCRSCDFKTFIQTSLAKHIETDHLRT